VTSFWHLKSGKKDSSASFRTFAMHFRSFCKSFRALPAEERVRESESQRVRESERVSESESQRVRESVSQWASESEGQRVRESKSQWVSEPVSQWVSGSCSEPVQWHLSGTWNLAKKIQVLLFAPLKLDKGVAKVAQRHWNSQQVSQSASRLVNRPTSRSFSQPISHSTS